MTKVPVNRLPAKRQANRSSPEVEYVRRDLLIEERAVFDRILVVDRLESTDVARIGANAEVRAGEEVHAGADVEAAVVAGDVVEDVGFAAQLRADGAEARRDVGLDPGAARAANRNGQHHV